MTDQRQLTRAEREERFLVGAMHMLTGPGLFVVLLTIAALLGWRHG